MRRHGRVGGLPWGGSILIFLGGTCFAMLTAPPGWWGSWRQAIDNGVGTIAITGPLLAGLVAGSYAALRGTTLPDLAVASSRRYRVWFGPATRLWVCAVVGLLALLAVMTIRAWVLEVPTPPRQFLIVPVGLLVLGVHALLGMVIGLRVSTRVAAVLAACTSFGLFLLANSHLAPPSFNTGGVTGAMYGEQYRLGSVVALCVFALASAVMLGPGVGWTKRAPRVLVVASVLAGVLMLALAQKTWPDVEARLESTQVDYRCERVELEICVIRERPSKDLGAIGTRLNSLAEPLRAIDVEVPDRWRQGLYGQPFDLERGVLTLSGEGETGGSVEAADLVRSLVRPAGCSQYPDGNEPPLVYGSRALIAGWIARQNGMPSSMAFPSGFSVKRVESWIHTTYGQLRRCDLDGIRRP